MTALQPFQQEGVSAISDAFRAGHRAVLYQLATGAASFIAECRIIPELTREVPANDA